MSIDITRRELLQRLATSLALTTIAGTALAQDTTRAARGAGRRGGAPRDMTPLVPLFEPTGWKTVWLDHLNYQCVDYKKAAAFYGTLMGWKVRSDDGSQCVMDIGDNVGGIVLRNGLTAAPPAAITDAGLGVTRPPVEAVFDGFAWGIAPWDEKRVKAELERRGLNPVADHHGDEYRAFRVKDPDGFDVAITNGTRANRRRSPATGKLPAKVAFEPTGWNTLYLDHISFEVPDYRRSAAFYQALLGWEMRQGGGGGQTTVLIGDGGSVGGAIIRGNAAARAAQRGAGGGGGGGRGGGGAPAVDSATIAQAIANTPKRNGSTAAIGHISFGIENWNTERVHDALKSRGVGYINADKQLEPRPDMTGTLESFHVPDAMGWDLQIGNKTSADH
ncbi:MAG TPA: VOC family protein [Gemmatimonadaceae bacterium]|jgi:catechol 2,3-dioxygenase-like lactoylglutathione lyase family enzyme